MEAAENVERPQTGELEQRTAAGVAADGKRIHGLVPYGVRANLGAFTEEIAPGALADADLAGLVAVIDHEDRGLPLARYPNSLQVEHRSDGLAWSFEPPRSRQDVVEALDRGDIAGSSWRMRVAEDRWQGDHRVVTRIAELRDITLAASQRPAYETTVEYRTTNAAQVRQGETKMEDQTNTEEERHEVRSWEERPSAGSLRIEDRVEMPTLRSLTEEFRSRGFPGEQASISFDEYRTATFMGGTATHLLNSVDVAGVALGADQRYLWQLVPQQSVTAGATSVDVFAQASRTLPAGTAIAARAIDAVTAKPEVASALSVSNTPLKQIAAIETNIPNVYLERDELATVVETDLRLAVNEGLDALVLAGVAGSGNQAPGSDNVLLSIRTAMSTIQASGYVPDTLVLTPAASLAIDTMVSGISGATADFVFGAGQFAGGIFGLRQVISKSVPAPVVLDASALGRLYAGPVSLAQFEVAAGAENRSNVRLELNAAFAVMRAAAAIRIAAS